MEQGDSISHRMAGADGLISLCWQSHVAGPLGNLTWMVTGQRKAEGAFIDKLWALVDYLMPYLNKKEIGSSSNPNSF